MLKYGNYNEPTRTNLKLPNYQKLLKYDKEDVKKKFIGQQSDTVEGGGTDAAYSLNGGVQGNINNMGIILPAGVLRNLRVSVGASGTDCQVFIDKQIANGTPLIVTYTNAETGTKEDNQHEYITSGTERIFLMIYAGEEGAGDISRVSWTVDFYPFQ